MPQESNGHLFVHINSCGSGAPFEASRGYGALDFTQTAGFCAGAWWGVRGRATGRGTQTGGHRTGHFPMYSTSVGGVDRLTRVGGGREGREVVSA